MLENIEKIEAYQHLSEKEKREFRQYSANLVKYVKILDVPEEKKKDVYNTLTEFRANYMAADHYVKQYNAVADKVDLMREKYRNETDDAKAVQYLEQYNKLKDKLTRLRSKYDYFNGKRSALSDRALSYDKFIDEQLVLSVEKQLGSQDKNTQQNKPKR